MRSGEALRLDQIDWSGRTLRLFRLKRRQPQIYPLVSSVAEALARYIDTVRPSSSCPEVVLCMQAPRPLTLQNALGRLAASAIATASMMSVLFGLSLGLNKLRVDQAHLISKRLYLWQSIEGQRSVPSYNRRRCSFKELQERVPPETNFLNWYSATTEMRRVLPHPDCRPT